MVGSGDHLNPCSYTQLAQKYPKLSMELIKRRINNREPRAERSEEQKKQLLSLIGLFEGASDLSEHLDEYLHKL